MRNAQRPMTAHLPMVEVLDVFFVEEHLQVAVEPAAKIGFQFGMQPLRLARPPLRGRCRRLDARRR